MGGKVALALAGRRPAGLRALVLLAPSPPTPEPIEEEWRAAMIAGWATYSTASRTLALTTAIPLREEARKVVLDDLMRVGKAAWTSWMAHGSREDWSREMDKVALPVTILSGTRDTVLPTDLVRREIVNRLAMSYLHTVPGAGHLLPFEAPDAVADAIGRAASDLSRKGRSADRAVGHPRSLPSGRAAPVRPHIRPGARSESRADRS